MSSSSACEAASPAALTGVPRGRIRAAPGIVTTTSSVCGAPAATTSGSSPTAACSITTIDVSRLLLVEVDRRLLVALDGELDGALLLAFDLEDELAGRHAELRERRLELETLDGEIARRLAANRQRAIGDLLARRRGRSRQRNRRLGRGGRGRGCGAGGGSRRRSRRGPRSVLVGHGHQAAQHHALHRLFVLL